MFEKNSELEVGQIVAVPSTPFGALRGRVLEVAPKFHESGNPYMFAEYGFTMEDEKTGEKYWMMQEDAIILKEAK